MLLEKEALNYVKFVETTYVYQTYVYPGVIFILILN